MTTGVKSVSAAREADGARAWEVSDRLARLALLVTGNPDRAYHLTRETLIAVGRDGPYVHARRKLFRKAVRLRVDAYTAGLLPGLGGLTPAARLWRRMMALPAAERALIVLTEAEGMADAVAGAVLGLPRVETERTLQRVRQVLESQAQLTETERREVFEGPALSPASSVVPAQALSRAQRTRRMRRLSAAAVAVVLVGGSVAFAVTREQEHGTDPLRYTGEVVVFADPARWPARGDLLDDRTVLRDAVDAWQANGFDTEGSRPTVVWAGRLGGSRRLVVLTGEDQVGDHVLGALLDRGDGPTLVNTQPAERAVAFGFSGLQPDAPQARRFLVAPWVSQLAVNDVAGKEATSGQGFRDVVLRAGLSEPWTRGDTDEGCLRPLLRLRGVAPGAAGRQATATAGPTAVPTAGPTGGSANGSANGSGDATANLASQYAVDVDDRSPIVAVNAPPQPPTAAAAYLTALRGVASCTGDPSARLALANGVPLAESALTDLGMQGVWLGRLPDGTPGQLFRLSWRVAARSGAEERHGQAYALVAGGGVRYSTPQFSTEPEALATSVGGLVWQSPRARRAFVVVAAGPAVRRIDVLPRPPGFRLGGPVVVMPQPDTGRLSAVGLDAAGRPVSVGRLDF